MSRTNQTYATNILFLTTHLRHSNILDSWVYQKSSGIFTISQLNYLNVLRDHPWNPKFKLFVVQDQFHTLRLISLDNSLWFATIVLMTSDTVLVLYISKCQTMPQTKPGGIAIVNIRFRICTYTQFMCAFGLTLHFLHISMSIFSCPTLSIIMKGSDSVGGMSSQAVY